MSPTTSSLYSSFEIVAPCIHLYNDVWPQSTDFIKDLEEKTLTTDLRWGSGTLNTDKGPLVDTKHRDVQLIGLPNFDLPKDASEPIARVHSLYKEVTAALSPLISEYCDYYRIALDHTQEGVQLLKYGVGQFFTPHIDDSPRRPRRVSYSYYVNEDYEGGEIVFTNFGVTVKPKAHQLLVFPSNYAYRHEVQPVTSGTRYAMVQWWN